MSCFNRQISDAFLGPESSPLDGDFQASLRSRGEQSHDADAAIRGAFMHLGDASSAGVTLTLPLLADSRVLDYAVVKSDSSANSVTVSPGGTDTIQGGSSSGDIVLRDQWDRVLFYAHEDKWLPLALLGTGVTGAEVYGAEEGSGASRSGDVITLDNPYKAGAVRLYVNGVRVSPSNFTETDASAGTITALGSTVIGRAWGVNDTYTVDYTID